jgi:hypothetical protein
MTKSKLHITVNCILIRSNKTCINNVVGECCQNMAFVIVISSDISMICISNRIVTMVSHSERPAHIESEATIISGKCARMKILRESQIYIRSKSWLVGWLVLFK